MECALKTVQGGISATKILRTSAAQTAEVVVQRPHWVKCETKYIVEGDQLILQMLSLLIAQN